ncbi:MAG: TIGR04551 family protein [Polyangiales bacterium]
MRFSSILCLFVVLGVPSVSWGQPSPEREQAQNQAPAGGTEPSEAGAAGSAAPGDAPAGSASEPGSAEEPATAAPGEQSQPAASEPLKAPAGESQAGEAGGTPELAIPTPGELGDRLVGDLPPPPDEKSGWTAPTPVLTLHGYLRVRGEMFDRFWLGRGIPGVTSNDPVLALGPDPFSRYRPVERSLATSMCADEGTTTEGTLNSVCNVRTVQFASMRFRFSPQLNISEDIRIKSTFDILDNYVLGDAPQSWYGVGGVSTSVFPGTNNPIGNLIVPRRVWAEVRNRDLGELRFGLMPDHWGLGMLYNAGNGLDDDFSSDLGRVQATTKLAGFYLSASYDFLNEGRLGTNSGIDRPGYDSSQLEDLDQFTFSVVRRVPDEDEDAVLARGGVLLNGGARFQLRHQDSIYVPDVATLRALDATVYTPDVWGQLRYGKLRLEVEAAWIVGSLRNIHDQTSKQSVSQLGAAFESELRLLNDKLGLYFYTGAATGDSEVEGLSSDANFIDHAGITASGGADTALNNNRVSTFRFHPAYRVDLILWRNIMRQVTGAMYFKPGISYDFVKDAFGQLFGARVDLIYSRATSPVQTWGNDPNLGVEIDAQVYWRSADGPNVNDGYHAFLQYGVLFPMQGLGYAGQTGGLSTAQTLRLVLGVMF